jgi:hypothetical protein
VNDLSFDPEKFLSLRPVNFKYKESCGGNGETEAGFIAEEVARIMPELVVYEYVKKLDADGKPIVNTYGFEERMKTDQVEGIKYDQMCVYLFKIVAAQEKRIKQLEEDLSAIRKTSENK